MDYKRTLHFQSIPDKVEVQPNNPAIAKIAIPDADATLKGFYINFHSTVHIRCLLPPNFFPLPT